MLKKISAFIVIALASPIVLATEPHYAILVDAGSSGSRLHLFEYQNETNALPIIRDISKCSTAGCSVKPGLSSFADHPENAGASLKPLLDDAVTQLTQRNINLKNVTINILATAGMRVLPASKQQAIYQNITQYLQTNYTFTPGKIETISGKLEGIYGWLDVNYLAHRFENEQDNTTGIIDMGGASTEIAFATNDHSRPDDETTLTLNGRTYTIFSKSFLGMGQDLARDSINQNSLASYCYPDGMPNKTTPGPFNANICGSLYTTFIKQNNVDNQLINIPNRPFIAYSGAYYDFHFFGVDQTPNQSTVEKSIQSECGKSWEEIKHDHPNDAEKYLTGYCANGVYVARLLFDAYQMKDQQLTVSNKIDDKDIDWTLGALLFELIG